jgi:hypothetical protein
MSHWAVAQPPPEQAQRVRASAAPLSASQVAALPLGPSPLLPPPVRAAVVPPQSGPGKALDRTKRGGRQRGRSRIRRTMRKPGCAARRSGGPGRPAGSLAYGATPPFPLAVALSFQLVHPRLSSLSKGHPTHRRSCQFASHSQAASRSSFASGGRVRDSRRTLLA